MNRFPRPATGALLAAFLVSPWANVSAAGQDKAPRRPPEPFRIFVYASDPAEPTLKAALEAALPAVRERVERRRHWFRLADSAETADLTVRVFNYRTGTPRVRPSRRTGGMMPGMLTAEPNDWREYHFVDAVVQSGGLWAKLSGLHEGLARRESKVRSAADHLAKELERFVKDNYQALRALAKAREPENVGAPPPSRNASPASY